MVDAAIWEKVRPDQLTGTLDVIERLQSRGLLPHAKTVNIHPNFVRGPAVAEVEVRSRIEKGNTLRKQDYADTLKRIQQAMREANVPMGEVEKMASLKPSPVQEAEILRRLALAVEAGLASKTSASSLHPNRMRDFKEYLNRGHSEGAEI